jgi:SAM-dependent methyltransferase
VGGGTSSLVDDLIGQGYRNITVLDISQAAIDLAKKRLGAESESVQWLRADVTRASLPASSYDLWHDRAVFHFLTKPEQRLAYVRNVASTVKLGGHVILRNKLRPSLASPFMPWERGRSLARDVRLSYGWNGQPLSDESVASLFGIRQADLKPSRSDSAPPVVGLAIRESGNAMRLHFRKRNRAGLRFEAARLLCDELIAPDSDQWLSATDSRSLAFLAPEPITTSSNSRR